MPNWDWIVQEYGPTVWRTAYRLLGRVDDAQDCFQDTFLSALKVSRRERVRNWAGLLCHLATARALDRLRKRCSISPPPRVDFDSVAQLNRTCGGGKAIFLLFAALFGWLFGFSSPPQHPKGRFSR